MRSKCTTVLVAICLVAAVGCSGDDGDTESQAQTDTAPSSTTTTTTTLPEYEPVFRSGPCGEGLPDDPRVECGELIVPSDRTAPDEGDVRLPVAIIRSADPNPEPDPIIYFSGGPGFDALGGTGFFLDKDFGGPRDVILFDQRGTGRAEPSLDCTEVPEVVWTILGAVADRGEELARAEAALRQCRARVEGEGIDLDDYDTPATADDVEDLRLALGIDEWNIFGVSYGTTVVLEMLRRHGDSVRSAILDSVYPPDAPAASDRLAVDARRALDTLTGGCAADPACVARYGDLDEQLATLVQEWDADPYEQDVVDRRTGETRHLVLTGGDLVAGLWNAMYDTSIIPLLPSVIEALRARNDFATTVVNELAGSGVSQLIDAAEAMTLSVNCADRAALGHGAPLDEVMASDPPLATLIAFSALTQQCRLWEVEPVEEDFNEIVASDVPSLVLAGDYDPVTPPEDSERTADTLRRSTYVVFPGVGHGAVFGAACAEQIFRDFVADPTAAVDDSCIDAMGPPKWAGT